MELKFCSLSSGSRGNAYVVWKEKTVFLIDVGISGKKIFEGLSALGFDETDVKGIFLTHEHIDHVKSLNIVGKKCINATVYTHQNTWNEVNSEKLQKSNLQERFVHITPYDELVIDDVKISPFDIHHDAINPMGYSISHNNRTLGIVTDTGHICKNIFSKLKDSNLLVLESNHEEEILKVCDYPYDTKMRILSDYGHLSNVSASNCLEEILKYRAGKDDLDIKILLAHLSKDNNTPDMAMLSAKNSISKAKLKEKIYVDVIKQDILSKVYVV